MSTGSRRLKGRVGSIALLTAAAVIVALLVGIAGFDALLRSSKKQPEPRTEPQLAEVRQLRDSPEDAPVLDSSGGVQLRGFIAFAELESGSSEPEFDGEGIVIARLALTNSGEDDRRLGRTSRIRCLLNKPGMDVADPRHECSQHVSGSVGGVRLQDPAKALPERIRPGESYELTVGLPLYADEADWSWYSKTRTRAPPRGSRRPFSPFGCPGKPRRAAGPAAVQPRADERARATRAAGRVETLKRKPQRRNCG